MSQSCAVCKKIAVQSCSACNTTYYCSKEHQKSHWKVHKNACAPFKTTSDEFGKTLIAIRNIEPKEKIVIKLPLIIGPVSEKEIICISCYKKIDQKSNSICPKCGLKLCGKLCENREEHIELCKIFETQNINAEKCTNLFKFLIPLKILILKTTNFKKFDIIMSNYLYEEPRECFKNVLDELLTLCGKLGISTTNEELSKIYVMSKRNFLEINHTKSSLIKGLYPVIPLLKQNCVPNTKRIFSEDANKLTVLSTILIKKGETLTSNFAEPLWGTLDRQSYLRTTKFINCSCVRCKDPTELNIYTSSIYCQKCKDKLLEDKSPKIVSTNPLDLEASWKCEKCDNEILAKQIAFGNKSLAREINNINMEQPKCLEHFYLNMGKFFIQLILSV
ncbi:hypothetical protein HHI36_014316 [Cryptolaemus montrouzieri]|uniref:MYND-type domain-containing protein n=1 Tax=Cryptolaemus montrouzieri TaxID=559131 RepID=A0ABD2N357_9CUCU